MGFLAGKRALIVGVANERSIAWGIAPRSPGGWLHGEHQPRSLRDRA